MRPSAVLLVLCATLLACTPASATWTGSAEQTASMEARSGSCGGDLGGSNCDTNAGTCNTAGNPPTCAKAKAAAAARFSVLVKVEVISATAACWFLKHDPDGSPFDMYAYQEYNCSTGVTNAWYGTSCFDTTSAFVPTGSPSSTYTQSLSQHTMLEAFTGGCAQVTLPLSSDPCQGTTHISHYRPGYNTTSGDLVAEIKKICPSWYTAAPPSKAAPTTTTPAPVATAPTDTKYFVTMTVTMPYRSVLQMAPH
jgi:hypothetical protein